MKGPDVSEARFEPKNLFPTTLSANKKIIWDIKIDKFSDRDFPWMNLNKNASQPEYQTIDVEKYKFKKTT